MKGAKTIGLGLLAAAAVALAPSAAADPAFGTYPDKDANIETALCTNLFRDTTRGMMFVPQALDKGVRDWVASGGDRSYVLAAYRHAASHAPACAGYGAEIMAWLNS